MEPCPHRGAPDRHLYIHTLVRAGVVIPTTTQAMGALLQCLSDNQVRERSATLDHLYLVFQMTDDEKAEKVKSGGRRVKLNHNTAIHHLKKAKLLEILQNKSLQITPSGLQWLTTHNKFTAKDLKQIPDYENWLKKKSEEGEETEDADAPSEKMEKVWKEFYASLVEDVLERLSRIAPHRFEEIVIELLEKMGYGIGEVTRKTRDGGIDGVIRGDKLEFDEIFVQAKRWNNNVSRKELQEFAGSLTDKKSNRGVFITTSDFTDDAQRFVQSTDYKIKLVNGKKLVDYMYEHGVGFQHVEKMEIKEVDEGYFSA